MKQSLLSVLILICLSLSCSKAQNETTFLSKEEVVEDLTFLDKQLQQYSSYQGLNGYSYQVAFKEYVHSLTDDPISKTDFGIFLTQVIGQIGDRHAYVKGYDLPESRFLPFAVAPYEDKVVAIRLLKETNTYEWYDPQFPYLKAINDEPIESILTAILPEDILAPKKSAFNRAVAQLKDIEECYALAKKELLDPSTFVLTNDQGEEKEVVLALLPNAEKKYRWYDKFKVYAHDGDGELNDTMIARKHFLYGEDQIAHIILPRMAYQDEAPIFFSELNAFMQQIKDSKGLIIDVRSNSGGGRDLIKELAQYIVHPDSIHLVNIAQQRCDRPISNDWSAQLNHRYLFAFSDLDLDEQEVVKTQMQATKLMYELPEDRFSQLHYTILNGKKRSPQAYHYTQPVIVLINERSFSAASVLAAIFKGLPNVTLAGVTTDGSSGNSEKCRLPNTQFKVRLSTMVSFQKNGSVLDGYGTDPDVEINRSMKQVLWEEDYQLDEAKQMILKMDR